jgi:hypothetical protein
MLVVDGSGRIAQEKLTQQYKNDSAVRAAGLPDAP